jgi:hypothetical protein
MMNGCAKMVCISTVMFVEGPTDRRGIRGSLASRCVPTHLGATQTTTILFTESRTERGRNGSLDYPQHDGGIRELKE